MNILRKTTDSYSAQSIDESVRVLHTDTAQGLNASEVTKRLDQYGYNEIEEKE